MNNLERIQKDYGTLILADGKPYRYEGEDTGNGFVYKDYEAFKTGIGVCYLNEYELLALYEELADLESRHDDITDPDDEDFIGDKEYEEDREDILANCGETRQSIIDQVREAFGDDYMLTDEQAEYFASDVFQLADWASIAAHLAESFDLDALIVFDHDYNPEGRRLFNDFQYEAVMAGMTPKEYQESLAR